MLRLPWVLATLVVVLIAASCGGSSDAGSSNAADLDEPSQSLGEPVVIGNLGGPPLEGHTPQGFAGMGTGLFVGDNLNANFPEGDGVQLFVAFELPSDVGEVTAATLSSENMTVRGTPFETLGQLRAQAVSFETFGPAVFDTPGLGEPTDCSPQGTTALNCDVTQAVNDAVDAGTTNLQLRLRFDIPGNGDGEQDMALFFLTDSNTNEPGIFSLTLE